MTAFIVSFSDNLRFVTGPFPKHFCMVQARAGAGSILKIVFDLLFSSTLNNK
jgi:hypothetical protein